MDTDNVELTKRIIGAAYTVLNALKPGLDEKLYERSCRRTPETGDYIAIHRSNLKSTTTISSSAL